MRYTDGPAAGGPKHRVSNDYTPPHAPSPVLRGQFERACRVPSSSFHVLGAALSHSSRGQPV
jgi:hypothetical protein